MIISTIIKKAKLFVFGGDYLLKELKKRGAKIGDNITIYGAISLKIDETRPYLLTIGNDVHITHGVTILTHDFSKCVVRNYYGEWIGEGAETIIGNNCFIGMNSTILMGSVIGDNTIIGAGSVVHGYIPNNVVAAGNPAKVICTLDDFYWKRKERTLTEAQNCAKAFYKSFGRKPKEEEMSYFRWLFLPIEARMNKETKPAEPIFNGFGEFIESIEWESV